MKMEEMVEYLRSQGFVAVKQYDPNARAYVFTITKDGVTVTDDFVYPVTRNFSLKDKAQRDFLYNLMTVWENRKFYNRFNDKKGESNMSNTNKLMNALVKDGNGKLVIGGDIYDIVVRDVVTDARKYDAQTTLTCDLVADGIATYARKDVEMTSFLTKRMNVPQYSYGRDLPKIKDVIFNPPATIVFWADNTKTVVKCQEGDDFDAEKGLTMAITKKIFGNKGNYCEAIKKWTKKYKPEPVELNIFELMSSTDFKEVLADRLEKVFGVRPEVEVKKSEPIVAETPETVEPEKRWKIWWKRYNVHGKHIGSGVHHTDYACKSSATRAAHRMFDGQADIEWTVSQDNPWEKD